MADQRRCAPAGVGRLGMIGIGHMGCPIARRLLHAGYKLILYDQRAEALEALRDNRITIANSVVQVADDADTVIVCLPNPAAVEQVVLGHGGLIGGGRVSAYIDLSTIGPVVARTVAASLSDRGVSTLDCPISGGIAGAADGSLAVMAAGDRALFARMRPVLEVFSKSLFYVGAQPGLAQVMKLINNLLSITAWTVTAEGLTIGAKAGLDPALMLEVLNASSGRNVATEDRYRRYVLSRTFDSGFTMAGIGKDLGLCIQQAERSGALVPVGRAVEQLWQQAIERGWGERSHAHIASLYELLAGVELKPR